ncbi:MAG: hypothetical protein L3J09_03975 [Flavobacteriaceae bacterium]|nr:hypothetical protein [Flavobacteriaceae bacterium]
MKNNSKENYLITILFFFIFIYLVIKPPIVSYDTLGYLSANIKRYPGYILFIRGFKFLFNDNYGLYIVIFQLFFGFISIFIIFKNVSSLLKFNYWVKIIFISLLLFPLFSPINLINNLASEGLSYPLYLLLSSFIIDFLFRNNLKKVYFISITVVALNLTRGQFFIIPFIVAFLYILKVKKNILLKQNLKLLILLLLLPLITSTIERTFKKIAYGYFITSPYSYVNAVTLPLFTSNLSDSIDIKDEHHRNIFILSHNRIDSLGLLTSKINGSYLDKYMVFHDNFPVICNQNIHTQGKNYYNDLNGASELSSILTEKACKEMFLVLIKNNFKEWISIYFTGIIYGFYSIYILFFFLSVFIYSGLKTLKKFTLENGLLFLGSLLIFSNSMIVGIACHSIMRYLIYNYFFAFIIIFIVIKKTKSKI